MQTEEVEALIETTLEAVNEQYILPLALALGTLTAALCRDRSLAGEVAATLRDQAASCPPDVAGRALLEALAALADAPAPVPPDVAGSALRKSLRLIAGGRKN